MCSIPQIVKAHRESAGLSLQDLSKISGVSDSTISKIENEERPNLRWDTVCALVKALNFSEEEFLSIAGFSSSCKHSSPSIAGIETLSGEDLSAVQLFVDYLSYRKACTSHKEG